MNGLTNWSICQIFCTTIEQNSLRSFFQRRWEIQSPRGWKGVKFNISHFELKFYPNFFSLPFSTAALNYKTMAAYYGSRFLCGYRNLKYNLE